MIEAFQFGVAEAQIEYGFAVGVALLTWQPNNTREIPPGRFDAALTAEQRLYYWNSRDPLWIGLAATIGDTFADVVAQQAQVQPARVLETAQGETLDELGYGVGLRRSGLGDTEYRVAIRAAGGSLSSSGTIPDVLRVATAIAGPDVGYTPWYPAGFALTFPALSASEVAVAVALLREPIPAGVTVTLVITSLEISGPGYSDPATDETWTSRWSYSGGADASVASGWGFAVSIV